MASTVGPVISSTGRDRAVGDERGVIEFDARHVCKQGFDLWAYHVNAAFSFGNQPLGQLKTFTEDHRVAALIGGEASIARTHGHAVWLADNRADDHLDWQVEILHHAAKYHRLLVIFLAEVSAIGGGRCSAA